MLQKSSYVQMQFCMVLLYILDQPHPSGTPTIQIVNLMIYYIYWILHLRISYKKVQRSDQSINRNDEFYQRDQFPIDKLLSTPGFIVIDLIESLSIHIKIQKTYIL